MVKELKEKFLRGKTFPPLSKVEDIHAITGLLKDFLRNLKEPLLTFRLNSNFMEAAGESELKLKLITLSFVDTALACSKAQDFQWGFII